MANILTISPSINVKGGISTVVKGYLSSELTIQNKMYFVSSHKDGSKFIKLLMALCGFFKAIIILIAYKIDIVHIHSGDLKSVIRKYFFVQLASLFSCRIIFHFHGASFQSEYVKAPFFLHKLIKEMFEKVDCVICLSKSWKNFLKILSPSAKVIILANGIEIAPLSPQVRQTKTITILFMGLIGKRKGVFDLLISVSKLKSMGVDFRLIIGGNGDIVKLKQIITKLKIENITDFKGWISPTEKVKILKKADIFVLPSYGEGLPMSILEAMSYGVPVVSTKVGGIPELIQDSISGFLIEPGNIEDLTQKIRSLIEDDQLRRNMGSSAKKYVKKYHDIKIIVKKLGQIYNDLI